MLVEMACLIGGVPLGYALRSDARVVKATEQTLVWSVRVLLFLLGLALGSDDALMAGLGTIGLRGAFISVCCLAGTLVGARLLQPFIHMEEGGGPPAAGRTPPGNPPSEGRPAGIPAEKPHHEDRLP